MSTRKTSKLWFGIGAAALAGGSVAHMASASQLIGTTRDATPPSAAASAVENGHDMRFAAAATATARQGGEGGESGAAADVLDPRVRFLRDLSLIRGHLLVGDELVQAGLWDDALPHFFHPVEEIYPAIGEKLKVQGYRQFDDALKALTQAVLSKNAGAYATARKIVGIRLNDTDLAMKRFAEPLVSTRVATAIAVLRTAASEYGAAAVDGRITLPVEYQDGRGFVLHAEQMLESIAKDLEAKDPAALAATRAAMADLKLAWPTAVPPAAAAKTAAAVLASVSRVELAAGAFLKK